MDRNWLNDRLLSEAEERDNVTLLFDHKLVKCDVSKGSMTFLHHGEEKNVIADVIIGADGVYSQVRTNLMRHVKYLSFRRAYQNGLFSEIYRLYVV